MWFTLAAAVVLAQAPAPAPAGTLALTNVRSTFGSLGAARPAGALVPGDTLFIAFDIEGVPVDADSKAVYAMAMEVTDSAGKVLYKQEPAAKADFVPFGGKKLPGQAFIAVGQDQPAGDYTLKITVTEPKSKQATSLAHKFAVGPKAFAVAGVYVSVDDLGQIPASTSAVVGQSVFVHYGVVGFNLGANKQPDVAVEMTPLDDAGTPTMLKPSQFKFATAVDEMYPGLRGRHLVPVTRPGKFMIRLTATDALTKKTATFLLPLTAVAPAN